MSESDIPAEGKNLRSRQEILAELERVRAEIDAILKMDSPSKRDAAKAYKLYSREIALEWVLNG